MDIYGKYNVVVDERPEYAEFRKDLEECAEKINARVARLHGSDSIFSEDFIQELKEIMARTGNDCASMHTGPSGNV